MSAKRRADDDLNHENWDSELKQESAGEFKKASNDIIQKRIIRTAKRRQSGSPASYIQEPPKNLFSTFSGLKPNTSNSEKDLKSTFSFLNSSSVTTNGNQQDLKIDKTNVNVNPTLSSLANSSVDNKNASSLGTMNGKKYPPKLIRLNKDVADWIKSHVDKDPCCILTPIFRDYERYLKEIESTDTTDKSDKTSPTSSSTESATKTGSNAATFSFFKPDSNSTPSTLLSKPDQASLMVNPFTSKQNKDEESTGAGTKGLSFGVFPQQSSSPSTGFSFGGAKPFTFGNLSASTTSMAGEKNDGETEAEESDEPPKPDFKPVKEDDAVYSKRCKVFIKKEAGYADLGVGTLYVKPVAGEKHQLIVRADTSLGNVLINVLLTSGIPLQRMAKNNVMMICVPTPPAPGASTPAPSTVLLRVKTSEEADQLLSNLEKYRK